MRTWTSNDCDVLVISFTIPTSDGLEFCLNLSELYVKYECTYLSEFSK